MGSSEPPRRRGRTGDPPPSGDRDALQRALEAAAFAGTWAWDEARDVVILDHGGAALITGGALPEGTALSRTDFLACVHPDDRDWLRARFALALPRTRLVQRHYRLRWPDGEIRAVQGRGRLEVGPGGSVMGRGIFLDVTGQVGEREPAGDEARLCLFDATIDHVMLLRDAVRRLDAEPSVVLADTLLLALCEDAAVELGASAAGRRSH